MTYPNYFQEFADRLARIEGCLLKISEHRQPTANLQAEEKPLNVEEAAKFLGVSKQTVYQNIDRIPHTKRFGRLYFFTGKLTTYVEEGKKPPNCRERAIRR